MFLQFKNYRYANEVLYTLDAVDRTAGTPTSKLGLQKILYLSASFAPIKDIVLSILRFKRIQRGPYSYHIQNTVDHLAAYGLVEIVEFKILNDRNSLASYNITEGGRMAIENLRKYSFEDEKAWWIECITRLSYIYSNEDYVKDGTQFKGIDKIVRLVYKDKTFVSIDEQIGFGGFIDFQLDSGITQQLISFTKNYIESDECFNTLPEKVIAELILLAFFEQLFANYYVEMEVKNE